jgi:hypothetical protein
VEPRGLGDDGKLPPQRERIEFSRSLVELHAHALSRTLHADPDVGEDDRVLKRRQPLRKTLLQCGWALGARDGGGAAQHFRAVALDHPDFGLARSGSRLDQGRLHLFAFEGGAAIVRR